MDEQLIIDRFEDEWAIIKYGGIIFNFSRKLILNNVT